MEEHNNLLAMTLEVVMTNVAGALDTRTAFSPSFFLLITLAMAFFVFAGFGLTYLQPIAAGTGQSYPPVVHLHGAFYFCWMLLLVIQAVLVNMKSVRLHRTLGTFGIFLGSGVILMGTIITVLFAGSQVADPVSDFYNLMYLAIVAVVGFSGLFIMAIRRVRVPADHKRLILFATIVLLPPGINRLYMVMWEMFELPVLATYLTMDVMAAAIVLYDWRTLGRISRASLIGTVVVVLPQLLHPVLVDADSWVSFYEWLASLTYYR